MVFQRPKTITGKMQYKSLNSNKKEKLTNNFSGIKFFDSGRTMHIVYSNKISTVYVAN